MIVDANVAFKRLVEEDLSANAARLIGRADLVAPTLLDIEILQVLTRRVRQRLLDRTSADKAFVGLKDAPIERMDWAVVERAAFDLSLDLHATFADCIYLALAVDRDDILITADERFARTVESAPLLAGRILRLSAI